MKTYKDLRVWQYGYRLCLEIHRDTSRFPAEERYDLARDLRRTSRSVIYNIGEGAGRRTVKEQVNFLSISAGSTSELEIQVMLSRDLGHLPHARAEEHLARIADIRRMLFGMMKTLRASIRQTPTPTRTPDAGRRTPKRGRAIPPGAG